jgi:hypothetical protein
MWKRGRESETESYERAGEARKSDTSGKGRRVYPFGEWRDWSSSSRIALRGIGTMTNVRALESLASLRVSERDERSRRFGMSERAWLEQVDRRRLSGHRNETSKGCRESKENDERRPDRDKKTSDVGEDS